MMSPAAGRGSVNARCDDVGPGSTRQEVPRAIASTNGRSASRKAAHLTAAARPRPRFRNHYGRTCRIGDHAEDADDPGRNEDRPADQQSARASGSAQRRRVRVMRQILRHRQAGAGPAEFASGGGFFHITGIDNEVLTIAGRECADRWIPPPRIGFERLTQDTHQILGKLAHRIQRIGPARQASE